MPSVIKSRGERYLNMPHWSHQDITGRSAEYSSECGMQVLAPHIKITMIPAPAPEAEQGAAAATARPRARPDQEELVPHLEAFLKAHPEIKSQVKMAKVTICAEVLMLATSMPTSAKVAGHCALMLGDST